MAINLKQPKRSASKAVEHIKQCYNSSLQAQRPMFSKYNEWYRIYRAIRDEDRQNYAGRAKLFIPYVFATIETIIPRLIGNKPKIEAIPREPNDVEKARANTSLFDYEWDMMNMKVILKNWVKQALIYGHGIIKLYWEFDEENETDHPEAEVVDLFDFFYDPNATTIDNASYVIHRTERSLDELKANENYEIPRELEARVQQDEYKVQRDAILGLVKPSDKDAKKVEVFEYWGEYDLGDGMGEQECLLVVANREHLIRAEKNPFEHGEKPFIKLLDVEDPHSFEGIGEVEQLASLQYELNDIRNQRMDNVTLILNRMWKVVKTGDVDEEDLVSQAGQVIHVGDKDALEPIVTPDVTASAYNEETLVKQDMQHVSGVSDYTRGMGGQNTEGGTGSLNRTATGVLMLQEAANARFKYKLDNIEDALREFGKQLLGLNQQFVSNDLMLRITGRDATHWLEIPADEIKGQFDIMVEAGSTQPMNKSVRRAEARELLNTVVPLAQAGMPINISYFIKYLVDTYDLPNAEQAIGMVGQAPPMVAGQGQGTGVEGQALGEIKSEGAQAVEGLSGPEFTGLAADILANVGNG